MTYKGYTIDRLKSLLDYDSETGEFKSKLTNKVLVGREYSHRDEETKQVTQFQLARVAILFMTDDYIQEGYRVKFKDGDIYNIKYSNLVVVPHKEFCSRQNDLVNRYLETEYEHIYVGTVNKLFVVRRGPDQAIYRTYNKEEAVGVMNKWLESNKTLHEWDKSTPKWFRDYMENPLTEQEMKQFDAKLEQIL